MTVLIPLTVVVLVFVVVLAVRRLRLRQFRTLFDYAAQHPGMRPEQFYHYYKLRFCVLPMRLQTMVGADLQLPVIDFRKSQQLRRSYYPGLPSVWATFLMARLGPLILRLLGQDYLKKVCDQLTTIWTARICQLAQIRIEAEGLENLDQITGPVIMVSNHKSIYDFLVTPLVLGLAKFTNRPPLRLRYIAAKDHFLDNFFIYRIVRIGMAMQAVGMIFVDRSGKDGKAAIDQAVDQLLSTGVDIAIYPQGTRAAGQRDTQGQRWDAGYFAVGDQKRQTKEGGHLKKGAAHLAMRVASRTPVWILPVTVHGTANVCPKKGLEVQLNETVKVVIGKPFCIQNPPSEEAAYTQAVEALHQKIDQALIDSSGIIPRLDQRLLTDSRRVLRAEQIDRFAEVLRERRVQKDVLFFAIADQIYGHPLAQQAGLLFQFMNSAIIGATREELLAMKAQIAAS